MERKKLSFKKYQESGIVTPLIFLVLTASVSLISFNRNIKPANWRKQYLLESDAEIIMRWKKSGCLNPE